MLAILCRGVNHKQLCPKVSCHDLLKHHGLRDAGEWVTAQLPWHAFVPVNRARVDRNAPPLNPSSVRQLGLVRSIKQALILANELSELF